MSLCVLSRLPLRGHTSVAGETYGPSMDHVQLRDAHSGCTSERALGESQACSKNLPHEDHRIRPEEGRWSKERRRWLFKKLPLVSKQKVEELTLRPLSLCERGYLFLAFAIDEGQTAFAMRRFLASAWFPFITVLVLAAGTTAAYALLHPTGNDIYNAELLHAFRIAGWASGGVIGFLSFILIGILNIVRRILHVRRIAPLHSIVVFLGIVPWFIFAWQITEEPLFTPFARVAIAFVGRPMLWGSLGAILFVLFFSIPLLIPKRA